MLKAPASEYSQSGSLQKTSVAALDVAELACSETRSLVQIWKTLRGWHAMPAYRTWLQSSVGPRAEHASMARVIDDGHDYEFDFIGDAHVRAYGIDHQGRRVSDIAKLSPRFGKQLKASYDLVRISGHPHAFQGAIGSEDLSTRFIWFETAYLPFGEAGCVDCILNAAVYRMREAA